MSNHNFKTVTNWLLVHEGGYVNHPKDPGGATNKGVIQRTYDGYRSRMGKPKQSVKNITNEEVWAIYKSQYWDPIAGDHLPSGLDYAVYDFAVNSGPSRAIKFLQKLLGVKVDGVMANGTLGAVAAHKNIEGLIEDLCMARWNWMRGLKTFATFGKGWTRRVLGDEKGIQLHDHGVIDRAIKLHRGTNTMNDTPMFSLTGKAEEEDISLATMATEGMADENNILKVAGGSIPTVIGALPMLPEGPVQWAFSFVLIIASIAVIAILWRKFNKVS